MLPNFIENGSFRVDKAKYNKEINLILCPFEKSEIFYFSVNNRAKVFNWKLFMKTLLMLMNRTIFTSSQ